MIAVKSIFLLLLIVTGVALGAETGCPQHYLGGAAPDVGNPKLAALAREVCYQAYGLQHSGITRTALWSAEHLTRNHVLESKGLHRRNDFHPDEHIPYNERAELADYARSGFDRGHMTPSGDAFSENAQAETFSLANMVPQAGRLNRGAWEALESVTRDLAIRRGDLYVITGPLFQGISLQRLHGRVLVPTKIWKAIYVPSLNQGGAWIAENTDDAKPRTMSIAALEREVGLNLFPKLDARTKTYLMDMPEAKAYRRNYTRRQHH